MNLFPDIKDEENLMYLLLNYRRKEENQINFLLNYPRNKEKWKYSFLDYR